MASRPKTLTLDHDELIASLIAVRRRTSRAKVAAAFAIGLRGNRLDLRSPLGSYAFHLRHPRHQLAGFNPSVGGHTYLQCKRCPFFDRDGRGKVSVDFARLGKVRSSSKSASNFAAPAYALADLTWFADVELPEPAEADWAVLRELLRRVRQLPATSRLGNLEKALVGVFKADKYGRRQVLEILGFCGVLQPKDRPLVTERFFYRDKDQFHPHFHTRDWAYPVSWWTGADGVQDEAVAFWFPELP